MKQDKVDIVAAHIARSIVNNDAMISEGHDVEDEEYGDDVVLEEISGDDSDEDETTDTAQESEKMTVRVTMTARTMYSDYDDNDDDADDDNDDSGGGVSDAINEGSDEEVQISDILCTTKFVAVLQSLHYVLWFLHDVLQCSPAMMCFYHDVL